MPGETVHDVLVVGAGPVGLACALEASRHGLSHLVVEKGCLLATLEAWPTFTVFFSTPDLLEIGGVPFVTAGAKPTRREGLVYYRKVAERAGLNVRLFTEVQSIARDGGTFLVRTSRESERARRVIVATGFFDNPNLLGIPGEELPKVSHYYTEPFRYAFTDVLVVGGKNSAVEAALELYRHGARVTMAVRKPSFGASVKYWLRPDIENRVAEGSVAAHFETTVASIAEGSVTLSTPRGPLTIPNDFVLLLTGYHPDYEFLERAGIRVTPDRHVAHDPDTMETDVPGLYVAGVVAAGVDIGRLFIENGRLHAAQIVRHILESSGRESGMTAPPALRRFQDGD